jgi:hypothetical protein
MAVFTTLLLSLATAVYAERHETFRNAMNVAALCVWHFSCWCS